MLPFNAITRPCGEYQTEYGKVPVKMNGKPVANNLRVSSRETIAEEA
jgi:hypothetical protein